MAIEELKGDEYSVEFDNAEPAVSFRGTIRLQSSEDYAPIVGLMQKAYESSASALTLDFRTLQFLNSAGINTISKFVIAARKEDRIALRVKGSKEIYWQQKSLQNLQKLWPKVRIDVD